MGLCGNLANESHTPSAIQYLHHKFPHSAKNGFALVQPTARVFHSPNDLPSLQNN